MPAHLLSSVMAETGHRTTFMLVVGTFLVTWRMHCLSFLSVKLSYNAVLKPAVLSF